MCTMTLFLAWSESSSVFGISAFILNYFQLALDAEYGWTLRVYMQLLNSFTQCIWHCISSAKKSLFYHAKMTQKHPLSGCICALKLAQKKMLSAGLWALNLWCLKSDVSCVSAWSRDALFFLSVFSPQPDGQGRHVQTARRQRRRCGGETPTGTRCVTPAASTINCTM